MRLISKSIYIAALVCGLFACSKRDNKPVKAQQSLVDVQQKRDAYLEFQKGIQGEHGWLDFECDGLLYNSLAAYSGTSLNIYAAREDSGRWRRTPDFNTCKPGSGAKSTISKDMFRGLLLYLWQKRDAEALSLINAYGDEHKWVMGDAEDESSYWGRVVFWTMVPQIKDMVKILQPSISGLILSYNDEYGPVVLRRTYEAHLHVLNIYLRSKLYDGITDYEKAVLQEYTRFQPRNALFAAMWAKFSDGNYQSAINILMDESLFPSARLPSSQDRCAGYLFAKEEQDDTDWRKCDEGKVHSGTDLAFVVKIMEDEI